MFVYYYIVPLVAMITYFILALPCVERTLLSEIGNLYYQKFINGVIILSASFIAVLIMYRKD